MLVCAEIWLATPQYWEIYKFLVLMIDMNEWYSILHITLNYE